MSEVLNDAVEALNAKMSKGFDGKAKFVVKDEGTIMVDENGARIGDEDADVTLTASAEVFQKILDGKSTATWAFMSGKLLVDGNMGMAMRLGGMIG